MKNHITRRFSQRNFLLTVAALACPISMATAALEPPSGLCAQTPTGTICAKPPVNNGEFKWHPGHYGLDEVKKVIDQKELIGVKRRYSWRHLEPVKGKYDFSEIERDLAELEKHGKYLVVQVQNKEFGEHDYENCAPEYIWDEGGVYFDKDRSGNGDRPPRAMAQIYKPWVLERFEALVRALGDRFDKESHVVGVGLPETAGQGGPGDDIARAYLTALMDLQRVFAEAFPHTVRFQAANWISLGDSAMKDLFDSCERHGCGISGPDLMPRRVTTASKLYPQYHGRIPLGIEGQTLEKFGVSPQVAFDFAIEDPRGLRANYVFWKTRGKGAFELPKIISVINGKGGKINSELPANLR